MSQKEKREKFINIIQITIQNSAIPCNDIIACFNVTTNAKILHAILTSVSDCLHSKMNAICICGFTKSKLETANIYSRFSVRFSSSCVVISFHTFHPCSRHPCYKTSANAMPFNYYSSLRLFSQVKRPILLTRQHLIWTLKICFYCNCCMP